jgi:acyl dehydratase
MNNLSVGQKATRSITLTSEHVKTYAEMTGDHNPLMSKPMRK